MDYTITQAGQLWCSSLNQKDPTIVHDILASDISYILEGITCHQGSHFARWDHKRKVMENSCVRPCGEGKPNIIQSNETINLRWPLAGRAKRINSICAVDEAEQLGSGRCGLAEVLKSTKWGASDVKLVEARMIDMSTLCKR